MSKMIARMICLMLALIMTLCAAMPVLAEGDTGSETATDADSLADALGLTDEERELLTELDPSEKVQNWVRAGATFCCWATTRARWRATAAPIPL